MNITHKPYGRYRHLPTQCSPIHSAVSCPSVSPESLKEIKTPPRRRPPRPSTKWNYCSPTLVCLFKVSGISHFYYRCYSIFDVFVAVRVFNGRFLRACHYPFRASCPTLGPRVPNEEMQCALTPKRAPFEVPASSSPTPQAPTEVPALPTPTLNSIHNPAVPYCRGPRLINTHPKLHSQPRRPLLPRSPPYQHPP